MKPTLTLLTALRQVRIGGSVPKKQMLATNLLRPSQFEHKREIYYET